MKIRTKLLAIAVVPITAFLATGMILIVLHRDMQRAHERVDLNDEFGRMISNLLILTYEYGISHEERPKMQWQGQYSAVGAHINRMRANFKRPSEKSLLDEIGLSHKTAGALFEELSGYDSKTDFSRQTPMALQFRNNMTNRLILELQAVIPPLDSLTKITHEDQVLYARSESLLVIMLLLSLVAVISPLSFFIIRGISRSLSSFQQGMQIISSGNLEYRLNIASGDELGALALGFDEMTAQLRSVTVSRDELAAEIKERKKAEEALREAQRIARVGSWSLDIAANTLIWSDEIYQIFEIDPAAFGASYEAFLDAVHPDDRALVNEAYMSSVSNRTVYSIDHRLLMKDNRIKYVHEQCETAYDREGKPLFSLGTVQDITDRKMAEEQFVHEAAINAGMSELSEGVLVAASIEEISVITLRKAQEITGSRFGFVGHMDRTTGALVCPTMTHDIWDQCGVSGKSIVFEKHGGLFGWVLKNKKPLLTNDPHHDLRSTGVPSGHIPVNRFISVPALHGDVLIGQIALANAERDYTDEDLKVLERFALIYALGIRRKQAEEDLLRLNEDLELRVADRTAGIKSKGLELRDSQHALMNIVDDLNEKTAELESANRKLQELDRLKSMFIASMSHELRTPLNSIIGFSSIMHNEWVGHVTDEQRENLAIILRSGRHLLSLINDVIDVSKVEAGIFESSKEDFDLTDVVAEAVSSLLKEAKDRGLAMEAGPVRLQMHTDRKRLLQCLLNLLSNAVKFTEKGSVFISSKYVAGAEELVEISVEDTGIGIAHDDVSRLFKPFVRLESPLKLTVPGTGLGLYLTKKLVTEVLKGEIIYMKSSGKGSRFVIRIPVKI